MQDFIKKLRESDESTKMRWLVVSSAIMMVFVIFFWMKYFTAFVAPTEQTQQAEQNSGQTFGFWQTFKSGLGIVAETIGQTLGSVINTIREPKSYEIKPQ